MFKKPNYIWGLDGMKFNKSKWNSRFKRIEKKHNVVICFLNLNPFCFLPALYDVKSYGSTKVLSILLF